MNSNQNPGNHGPPGNKRSSSSIQHEQRRKAFEALREELSRMFGIPTDCRIYFLKKHDIDNLPKGPRVRITFGNSVLLDADTWKVLQVNRFIPFLEMTSEKKDDMDFVIKTLYEHTLARGEVKINSSVQGLKDWGEMRAAGFRPGSDKGRTMGVTALSAKTSKDEVLILKDQDRMLDLALVNEILAEWMATLCLGAFKSNRDLALKYEVPSFSDTTWAKSPNANVIASSVVVTRDGFNNKPHQDLDETLYTFGIFTRINRQTGDLYSIANSDYLGTIVGTVFTLNEYHVELALDMCDGTIESIWLSHEFHQTSSSTTFDKFQKPIKPKTSSITRFGCSLQISAALVKRIDGLLKQRDGVEVIRSTLEAHRLADLQLVHSSSDQTRTEDLIRPLVQLGLNPPTNGPNAPFQTLQSSND
ncbi:hypothetical protein DFH28DRAFT_1118880 [Melampsora americana]|nr:hypothetical protein DFH28DRAFT_1118880 [Melampsora americana]